MLSFRNDYSEGAHPAVLEALQRTNLEQTIGYGTDAYCQAAADTIRSLCKAPQAAVHFLVGGTQVNKTAIGAFLRPYEAVISADTGHICVHETGAIEHNGHKAIALPAVDGKLTPALVCGTLEAHVGEHMVLPRLVYLSNTTEVGTVYTRQELADISACCREHDLLLYCDGARLGSAMTVAGADTTFADYAALCDAFTIGGTKNGLLFGEALVITNPALQPNFRYCMKQQGAILAKGRLLGLQFSAILKDGLYLEVARHANTMAAEIRRHLERLHIPCMVDSPSNQIFPIFTAAQAEKFQEQCACEVQHVFPDGRVCLRLVTSWATPEADVAALGSLLESL